MAKIGPYIRLLLLLKHSLVFIQSIEALIDSNLEMHFFEGAIF